MGAPRIHGELLKLGIDIAQSTVAKYMSRRRGPRSPGWQAFLRNYTTDIAAFMRLTENFMHNILPLRKPRSKTAKGWPDHVSGDSIIIS